MRRFRGEPLPKRPSIAVIANDALGNYVVSTPLLQMLKARYPDSTLHYFSGLRTQELWRAESLIDSGWPLFGSEPRCSIQAAANYDLVVNIEHSAWAKCFAAAIAAEETWVCGPCLSLDGRGDWSFPDDPRGDLWRDQAWIAENLLDRYRFLTSGFIGEIFCRLAYLDGPVPKYRVPISGPDREMQDVLIASSASLPEKLWPASKWIDLVQRLKERGHAVGLLGAKPKDQSSFWKGSEAETQIVSTGLVSDLRGSLTLPQVVGALARAKLVVTLDNGILHLAAATDTPTIGLFRPGIHRLWAPPAPNLKIIVPQSNGAVSDVTVQEVMNAI